MENFIVNEYINVGAVFADAVKPKWFIWNKRKYMIEKVTYTWLNKQGEAMIMHFTVSSLKNIYEISFNQKTLKWKLESVGMD